MKLAIVGCGRIAQLHLQALGQVDSLRAAVACDARNELARATAESFKIPKTCNDLEEICRDGDVDAALVCLPHHLHADAAIRLARAGKHILIEKPLARTTAECDAIIDAADRAGVQLMVGHVMRFSEQFRALKRSLESGAIGRPVSARARRLTWHERPAAAWWTSREQCGGLAIPLIGSHILDTIFWLFGAAPKKVFALGRTVRPLWEGEDEAELLIELDSGALAAISLSMNSRVSVNDMLLVGDRDTLLATEQDLVVENQQAAEKPLDKFVLQMREFGEAILGGRAPAIDGRAGRRVVAAMEAAQRSMAAGKEIDL